MYEDQGSLFWVFQPIHLKRLSLGFYFLHLQNGSNRQTYPSPYSPTTTTPHLHNHHTQWNHHISIINISIRSHAKWRIRTSFRPWSWASSLSIGLALAIPFPMTSTLASAGQVSQYLPSMIPTFVLSRWVMARCGAGELVTHLCVELNLVFGGSSVLGILIILKVGFEYFGLARGVVPGCAIKGSNGSVVCWANNGQFSMAPCISKWSFWKYILFRNSYFRVVVFYTLE